jgi:hypothetical protein
MRKAEVALKEERKERKRRWLICKSGCRGGEWKGGGSG